MAPRNSFSNRLRFHLRAHSLVYQILGILGLTVAAGGVVILLAKGLTRGSERAYVSEEVLSSEEIAALELDPAEREFPQPIGTETYGTRRIIANCIEAHGGRDRMSKVSSILRTGEVEVFQETGESERIEVAVLFRKPNSLRYTYSRPSAQIVAGFDGEQSWSQVQQGRSLQPAIDLDSRSHALIRQDAETAGLVADILGGYSNFSLLETSPIADRAVYGLQRPTSEGPELFFIDQRNFLLLRRIDRAKLPDGSTLEIQLDYRNYRYVDGIAFPFEIDVYVNGVLQNQLHIKNIQLNIGALPLVFERPRD